MIRELEKIFDEIKEETAKDVYKNVTDEIVKSMDMKNYIKVEGKIKFDRSKYISDLRRILDRYARDVDVKR